MYNLDAIILAAGLSKRMGCNKLLLPLGGATLIGQYLARFPYTLFKRVIVVYGDPQVASIADEYPVLLCNNQNPKAGKSHSIQLGLSCSTAEDGVLFGVADQPLLTSNSIEKLVEMFCEKRAEKIIVPKVAGRAANPVIFPASCRGEFAQLQGDSGGRQLILSRPERVCYTLFSSGDEFCDVDTPESYQWLTDRWMLMNKE